jgi:hypothetical protein
MFDEADLAPLMVALLDQNKPRQYHNSQTTSLNSRLQALWDLYDDHSIAYTELHVRLSDTMGSYKTDALNACFRVQ